MFTLNNLNVFFESENFLQTNIEFYVVFQNSII